MEVPVTRDEFLRSVAFTGYRPHKLSFGNDLTHPDAIRLRAAIKKECRRLINHGFTQFLTGGALGCDMMAAEVILELKEEYRHKVKIVHWICMPCYHYTEKWNDADRERLKEIAKKSHVIFVSDSEYFKGCMQKRNRYMVNTARVLLAVYDGQSGGTQGTVEYARSKNRKVVVINPKQFMRLELIESYQDIQLMLTDGEDEEDLIGIRE